MKLCMVFVAAGACTDFPLMHLAVSINRGVPLVDVLLIRALPYVRFSFWPLIFENCHLGIGLSFTRPFWKRKTQTGAGPRLMEHFMGPTVFGMCLFPSKQVEKEKAVWEA